jgi:hypothetical protein
MPCSPLKVSRRFGGACLFHFQGRRISQARIQCESRTGSCADYSSTLKMEATCSFETSVDFQATTWRYIPEDRNLSIKYCLY